MINLDTAKEAEEYVAGAILIDQRSLALASPELSPEDFTNLLPKLIFQGAKELKAMGKPIDPITIQEWTEAQRFPIGVEVILDLMNRTPSASHMGEYSRIVHENALRRKVMELISKAGSEINTPLSQLLPGMVSALDSIKTDLSGLGLVRASEVTYEPPKWLIEPYFQRGKGTLIQADPGTGKTAFVCAIAAAVSSGKGFLGIPVQTPGNVLMVSTEDEKGVLRGRIEACGGNLDRIFFLQNASNLSFQSPEIENAVEQVHAKLVIFDPLQAFLGSRVDLFRANETRPILNNLMDMCAKHDCACAIIAHLGKQTNGKSAVNQSLGSVDIPGIMRSILHIAKNPSVEGERIAVHIKSSNAVPGKSIGFTIGDRGGVQFTSLSDLTLSDLTAVPEPESNQPLHQDILTVFRHLASTPRENDFYSYEDIRTASQEVLGYAMFTDARALIIQLKNPELLRLLGEQEGLNLIAPYRYRKIRGIRLMRRKESPGDAAPVPKVPMVPKVPVVCEQGDWHRTWEDEIANLTLPWEEPA